MMENRDTELRIDELKIKCNMEIEFSTAQNEWKWQ